MGRPAATIEVGGRERSFVRTRTTGNMLVFWLCSVALHCFSGTFGQQSADDPPLPMPTLSPAVVGNITISPIIKVKYFVELSSPGPAVLDSTLTFTAQLFEKPGRLVPKGEFRFLWVYSGSNLSDVDSTVSNHRAKLYKTFSSATVPPGNFRMVVVVSPKNRLQEYLATAGTDFVLTKDLNGHLKVTQDLDYQRRSNTFAIDRPVTFFVNLTDSFNDAHVPQFTFFWYNGSHLFRRTNKPRCQGNFSSPSPLHLEAEATAQFRVPAEKVGLFRQKLVFKESLSGCTMQRIDGDSTDHTLKKGQSLVLNISCAGSFPSAVCYNVTHYNASLAHACSPPKHFDNSTHHQVSVTMAPATGWQTLHLNVFNDVSRTKLVENFYIYNGDTVNIPALVLPIVFCFLGLAISGVGGVYILRLRRSAHVEVADFDFDPSISVRQTTVVASMMGKVKAFATKHLWRSNRGNHRPDLNRSHAMYENL